MPYATYRFNKIIAAETIRFIVTVAIVVYKGLKLVVYRMLTNITTVQKLLGHKSVRTTEIYSNIMDMTIVRDLEKIETRLKFG